MLLGHLTEENPANHGGSIQRERRDRGPAHDVRDFGCGRRRPRVEECMAPFAQAGSVEVDEGIQS
jgi:hypothetical protein